jgi:hypothetical protein
MVGEVEAEGFCWQAEGEDGIAAQEHGRKAEESCPTAHAHR